MCHTLISLSRGVPGLTSSVIELSVKKSILNDADHIVLFMIMPYVCGEWCDIFCRDYKNRLCVRRNMSDFDILIPTRYCSIANVLES